MTIDDVILDLRQQARAWRTDEIAALRISKTADAHAYGRTARVLEYLADGYERRAAVSRQRPAQDASRLRIAQ